jgi:23S rRNA pseudouridine1911/1915/1917 synthase
MNTGPGDVPDMAECSDSFVIDRSLPNERLDTFLGHRYPVVSRSTLQRLIEEGHITLNGAKTKSTHRPKAGERVEVTWPEARPSEVVAEDIPLDILFEDESLLVLNKPAGLVVHPAAGHDKHTLVNALLHHCKGQLSGVGGVARPGIIHRLDKDTSGCMVVAKSDAAHVALSNQFAGRSVGKVYHAIVCGELEQTRGEIRAAIARHPSHRKRMAVNPDRGRSARTSFKVLERLHSATLVEAVLHTGRTHQVRVHFQFLGHPLVGDLTYGQRQNRRLSELTHCSALRQMLHARELTFTHPRSAERMTFQSPWPEDFKDTLQQLRLISGSAAGENQ